MPPNPNLKPNSNPNANPNPTLTPKRGAIFLRVNFPDTKEKRDTNGKTIKTTLLLNLLLIS